MSAYDPMSRMAADLAEGNRDSNFEFVNWDEFGDGSGTAIHAARRLSVYPLSDPGDEGAFGWSVRSLYGQGDVAAAQADSPAECKRLAVAAALASSRSWGDSKGSQAPASIGMHTPWGISREATNDSVGIGWVLADNGQGFKLSKERNHGIHSSLRQSGGWYSSDNSDWAIVAMHFPEEPIFDEVAERTDADSVALSLGISHAQRLVRDNYPDGYEQAVRR